MATPPLPDDVLRETWEAVKSVGTLAGAARVLNIPHNTIQSRLKNACRTLKLPDPRSKEADFFRAATIPSKERSLDEIMRHRREESGRARNYEEAINLIKVDLATDGPVGLLVVGDPHIENPGCDFEMLERHLKLAADRSEYVFAGNIGDLQDNWIGRLERLYADTTVNSKETWKLVEWMLRGAGVRWTWLVRGNHDKWLGRGDPVDWISRLGQIGVDQADGVRIAFKHPNGAETRMHARHDFSGHSQFNPLHGLKKEVLHGFRDHIIVAGHRHIGADARDVNGDGMPFVMVRLSGYKVSDSYRHTLGLKAKPLHPAAMIIVDPDEPDNSNNRVWVAPTVEVGADFLDFKRKRYNARPRVAPKPKKRA